MQAWLALHEASTTQRAYRKEAERLILWAIVERGLALSSLTTEDATAYRACLRRPTPRECWIGPPRPRAAPDWRPFASSLSRERLVLGDANIGRAERQSGNRYLTGQQPVRRAGASQMSCGTSAVPRAADASAHRCTGRTAHSRSGTAHIVR